MQIFCIGRWSVVVDIVLCLETLLYFITGMLTETVLTSPSIDGKVFTIRPMTNWPF